MYFVQIQEGMYLDIERVECVYVSESLDLILAAYNGREYRCHRDYHLKALRSLAAHHQGGNIIATAVVSLMEALGHERKE